MKNFLIFLSILIVTLFAAIDLQQRMAELDEMSKNIPDRVEKTECNQKTDFDENYLKTHKWIYKE